MITTWFVKSPFSCNITMSLNEFEASGSSVTEIVLKILVELTIWYGHIVLIWGLQELY